MRAAFQWLGLWFAMTLLLVLPCVAFFDPSLGLKVAGSAALAVLLLLSVMSQTFVLRAHGPIRWIQPSGTFKGRVAEYGSAVPQAILLKRFMGRPIWLVSRGYLFFPSTPVDPNPRALVLRTVALYLSMCMAKLNRLEYETDQGQTDHVRAALRPIDAFVSLFAVAPIWVLKKLNLYAPPI